MAQEAGTGAVLRVKHGQGRESSFYGGSVHLTRASQKNLTLARRVQRDTQSDREYQYEVRQLHQKRWHLKQHLLRLRREKSKVTYLDGGSRGKPPSQWDTSIQQVQTRHARANPRSPYPGVSNSDDNMINFRRDYSQLSIFNPSDQTSSRLGRLHSAVSENDLRLGVSGKPLMTGARTTHNPLRLPQSPLRLPQSPLRLPQILDKQKISTPSGATSRPQLPHSNTTLGQFYLATRRRSRSLSDLKDLRETLKSAV